MGYPTFTFETDDEQFVPGSFENLNDRLGEEMNVMRYLIDNVWYWRARLDIRSIDISGDMLTLDVGNEGQASTSNATLQYLGSNGEVTWTSSPFSVNASNASIVDIDSSNLTLDDGGSWQLYYQVRVIDASRWVSETSGIEATIESTGEESNLLIGYGIFNPITIISALSVVSLFKKDDLEED
jgi:hypothetical protein